MAHQFTTPLSLLEQFAREDLAWLQAYADALESNTVTDPTGRSPSKPTANPDTEPILRSLLTEGEGE